MNAVTKKFVDELIQKFGNQIDLKSNPGIINEILGMVKLNPEIYQGFDIGSVAAYDKTYTRDYDKDSYDKRYHQYDKTVDINSIYDAIRPEIDILIKSNIDKFINKNPIEKKTK
jgi:hypothetical protein